MFMTRSLNVRHTPKTTEQRLIVRIDKSVAYVTIKECARRFVLLKLLQTRSIARPLRQQSYLLLSEKQQLAVHSSAAIVTNVWSESDPENSDARFLCDRRWTLQVPQHVCSAMVGTLWCYTVHVESSIYSWPYGVRRRPAAGWLSAVSGRVHIFPCRNGIVRRAGKSIIQMLLRGASNDCGCSYTGYLTCSKKLTGSQLSLPHV